MIPNQACVVTNIFNRVHLIPGTVVEELASITSRVQLARFGPIARHLAQCPHEPRRTQHHAVPGISDITGKGRSQQPFADLAAGGLQLADNPVLPFVRSDPAKARHHNAC